jgi:hypothetical protein
MPAKGWMVILMCAWIGAAAALPAAARESGRARQGDDFEWNGRVATGQTIEIHGVNGAVHAEWTSGDEVEVRADKHARRSDPDEVRIEVMKHEGGVTICAVYPSPPGKPANECTPQGSHSHTQNNDVVVDFTVRVPSGVRFVAETVNGEVEARSLRGDVEARSVNGSVRVSTTGEAQATTVNGSIYATLGDTRGREPLEFETVNGSITVRLPENTGADLRAETVNGDINTDFPILVTRKISQRRVSGTIGGGGRSLKLSTVNGSIHLIAER